MSCHGAMCDLAAQNMTAERRRDLQNAARLLAGAAALSTERLARLLGEAQGGSSFAPDFEADLLPLASVEHRDHGRRGDGPDPRRGDGDGFNVQHGRWAEHAAATLGIRVAMMAVVAVATGCSVPLP